MIRIIAVVGIIAGLGALLAGQQNLLTWAILAVGVIAVGVLAVQRQLAGGDEEPEGERAYEAGEPLPPSGRADAAGKEAASRDVTTIGGRDGRAGGYMGAGSDTHAGDGGGS
jgi:hypothetical protein